jgi:hypothetical protein
MLQLISIVTQTPLREVKIKYTTQDLPPSFVRLEDMVNVFFVNNYEFIKFTPLLSGHVLSGKTWLQHFVYAIRGLFPKSRKAFNK